ncbi:hypothetical protein SNEBB_002292 [Seison nebaliae]|nr:hypothetical protein SNEBB_002292 [Seison nebaliae]
MSPMKLISNKKVQNIFKKNSQKNKKKVKQTNKENVTKALNGIITRFNVTKTITNEALFQQLTQDTIYGQSVLQNKYNSTNDSKKNSHRNEKEIRNSFLKKKNLSCENQFKRINSIINELVFHLDLLLNCETNDEIQSRAYSSSNLLRKVLHENSPFYHDENIEGQKGKSMNLLNLSNYGNICKNDKRNEENEQDKAQEEWFKFTRIADIICFWVLTVLTLVATLIILLIIPVAMSDV